MKKSIVFRADSSPEIGMGHVYRLISLIKYLHIDFDCTLVTNNIKILPHDDLLNVNLKLNEINTSFKYCTPNRKKNDQEIDFDLEYILNGDEIVILDGYWFGRKYQQAAKLRGAKVIVIDDFANGFYNADIIINHAPGITAKFYNILPHTKLLLGPDFSILRPSFLKLARMQIEVIKKKKSVFICFGGSDYFNFTDVIVETVVRSALFEEIHVVVGKEYLQINKLKEKYGNTIILHYDLNEVNMACLMNICELAIIPSSSVLYEAIAAGCKIITGYYSNNQKTIYEGFLATNMVVGCHDFSGFPSSFLSIYKKILEVSTSKKIIDGMSDKRIKFAIENLC
jgi:UDP-2,4-diacetamido-2,4,6-trideoxy-beta-L-altropyranose hydrolase